MSAALALPTPRPDVLWLSALLSGLGAGAGEAAAALRLQPAGAKALMCIDGGASGLIAVRAPGPRTWEAHVVIGSAAEAESVEWQGLRIDASGRRESLWRTMFRRSGTAALACARDMAPTGDAAAAERFEALHRRLGPHGRIYSVGREPADLGGARVAWQLDRHVSARAVIAELIGDAGWEAGRASLSRVLGFDLASTGGPWSVSASIAAPALGIRLGTTRWAWAIEDSGKRDRLIRWIASHGGDGAHSAALHDLLANERKGLRTIGRAVEVDIVEGRLVAAIAYLGAALEPATLPDRPGATEECMPWVG